MVPLAPAALGAALLGAQAALLAVCGVAVRLALPGWAATLGCAIALDVAVAVWLLRSGQRRPGAADLVTLVRATATCLVAGLALDSVLLDRAAPAALVAAAVVALGLDAADGWVARRTRGTAFGAKLDGEADAFLILVLSVYVAHTTAAWVLVVGVVRYVFGGAGWVFAWMDPAGLPFRYWRKVVTAATGIVLVQAAWRVLPDRLTLASLVVVVVLLAESFGRDTWWLWVRRDASGSPGRVASGVATGLAALLVWLALLAPDRPDRISVAAFARVPVEGVALAAVALVPWPRVRRTTLLGAGAVLGLLTVLKVLDLGSFAVLGRSFDPVSDWDQLPSAAGFVRRSLGGLVGSAALVAAVVLALGIAVALPWAVVRAGGLLTRRRGWSRRTATALVAALAIGWGAAAALALEVAPGEPVAAVEVGRATVDHVDAAAASVRERRSFDALVATDRFGTPGTADLSGLRGKDVLVVFVESYGRVAVQGPASAGVQALLDQQTRSLRVAGYSARSAFLTSPTFGGSSWLAHATLQSGVWTDNQAEYDQLLASSHTTLASAFGSAGWQAVALLPSDRGPWPQGSAFYRYDRVYDGASLGYAGPSFGFSLVPDQFALEAFHRLQARSADPRPLMAEVDLASSHGPWAPQPVMVGWDALGNGSVFKQVHASAQSAATLWQDRGDVPGAYMTSIEYSLTALVQYVERYGDRNLVVVMLGDHQPATIVSGNAGNHDVPVTVLAKDPAVTAPFAAWGWQAGLRPLPDAPVWRMDAFRDRFLTAFSSAGAAPGDPQHVEARAPR